MKSFLEKNQVRNGITSFKEVLFVNFYFSVDNDNENHCHLFEK